MPDKILIIGGGFAGFWAALAARRVVTRLCLDRLKSVRREPPAEIVPSALYLLDLALRQEHGRWRVRGARAGSCAIYVMFRIGS
jgi:hypothetical protein